jgi:hypothetical protein
MTEVIMRGGGSRMIIKERELFVGPMGELTKGLGRKA